MSISNYIWRPRWRGGQRPLKQRSRLRDEQLPDDAAVVARGGRDSIDKLRTHTLRTARAWALDDIPLL